MSNRMILNETAYFGQGAINNIVAEVQKRKWNKALIITDKILMQHQVVHKVTELFKKENLAFEIFDTVEPNPTMKQIQNAIDCYQKVNADYIIGIGGGSPIDTAKAVGIVINNPSFKDLTSLEGMAPTLNRSVPIIAVPTTAGTASEVTINYVITDEVNRRKFVCVDPNCIPLIAIIDPDMMESMPSSLKAATGMDALTHAIEGFTTKGAWQMSDMFHLQAIELIARSLKKSTQGDKTAMNEMAMGQYIAGMGFSNVGLGLVHGMAHPLSAFYNTPHGLANAVLLPYVMEFNAAFTGDKYREIALAMQIQNADKLSLQDVRNVTVDKVRELNHSLSIPSKLREIGVKQTDLEALAKAAFEDVCTGGNPRTATQEAIFNLYQTAY